MQEFIKKFKEAVFEDNVYIRPILISENTDDLVINFNVFLCETEEVMQKWKVTCGNFESYKMTNDFFEDIDVYEEHVLLWEYSEIHAELFYTGIPNNKFELAGEIFNKHQEVTEGWIDFNYFLNKSLEWKSLDWLFSGHHGLFASGPTILLNEYKAILEQAGLKVSLLPSRRQQTEYQVLVFGRSFITAKEFIFEFMNNTDLEVS